VKNRAGIFDAHFSRHVQRYNTPPSIVNTILLGTDPFIFKDDSRNGYDLVKSTGFPDLFTNNSWMKTPVTTVIGSTPTSKAARFGAVGDDIQSSVTIPDLVLRPSGANGSFSIEFWMYVKRLPYNGSPLLFRFAQGATGNNSCEWKISNEGTTTFPQFYGPNNEVVLGSDAWGQKMTTNTWHQIKITFNAPSNTGTTSVYIDDMSHAAGQLQNDAPNTYYIGTPWQLSMGDFVGCIDELRISNTLRL
jgi:hypothetical protein